MKPHPPHPTQSRENSNAPSRVPQPVSSVPSPSVGGPEKIDPKWTWHYRTLLHLRDRWLRSQADYIAQVSTPPEMAGVDVVDTAQEKMDRDLLWAELGATENELFEVDCALQRIRDGVYGVCEETGLPIPPERLRALPWTRYCRAAAERHET